MLLSSISAQAKSVANHAIYSEAFTRCLAVGEYLASAEVLRR